MTFTGGSRKSDFETEIFCGRSKHKTMYFHGSPELHQFNTPESERHGHFTCGVVFFVHLFWLFVICSTLIDSRIMGVAISLGRFIPYHKWLNPAGLKGRSLRAYNFRRKSCHDLVGACFPCRLPITVTIVVITLEARHIAHVSLTARAVKLSEYSNAPEPPGNFLWICSTTDRRSCNET